MTTQYFYLCFHCCLGRSTAVDHYLCFLTPAATLFQSAILGIAQAKPYYWVSRKHPVLFEPHTFSLAAGRYPWCIRWF